MLVLCVLGWMFGIPKETSIIFVSNLWLSDLMHFVWLLFWLVASGSATAAREKQLLGGDRSKES